VILLSDGAPNVGAHTADALREVVRRHREDVSFFALGYGVDHCEDVLASIGGYEFVQDPAACARAFARALGVQADVVASGIELVIAPAEGVEIARFVGREDTRFSREGVIVSLPDMVSGARRCVVAELRVRVPGARFLVDVASVTLRARGMGALQRAIDVEVADRVPVAAPEAARRGLLVRADEARATARELADRGQFGGAASGLRKLMAEIDRLPGFARADGSPLGEAYELLSDEATAFERKPSREEYAAMRKMMVGSPVASHVPSAAKSRGAASRKLIEHIAGDCPKAWLVTTTWTRYALGEECVIGRTAEAEICVSDASVARRHAEVFADAGAYWVADLGSANPTFVNGTVLSRTPHRLSPGDVVRVGEVDLRYEES
jgi:Ca-activated chloride channel family protein